MTRSVAVPVVERSQVGEARRRAAALAAISELDETQSGKLALVVTELANNLVRHATGGQIVLRVLQEGERRGVEVLALDTGPGIRNVAQALGDGYSTGGTAGEGLGVVVRASEEFDLYTTPEQGTALLVRVWAEPPTPTAASALAMQIGAVCVPVAGETECGDGWAAERHGHRTMLAVVDGLGHGPRAAAAADVALGILHGAYHRSPAEVLQAAHAALRPTCGAVMAVAEIRTDLGQLRWAGVGNISGEIRTGDASSHLVSHNGTLGHQVRKVQEFVHPWREECLLLLHSDGLATLRNVERYGGLWRRDPALVAGVLYRDGQRGRDDTTVLAIRQGLMVAAGGER